MRVLILTQFFPPEIGATQTRLESFASGLATRGHEVEVICELPNHPTGVFLDGWRRVPVQRRSQDRIRCWFVWVYTRPDKTTRTRLLFYATYAGLASAVGMVVRRPDVVLASSPPLPVAVAGAVVAKRHRVPWIMDVRDLWPLAAVAMGDLSNSRALRWSTQLEQRLYDDAAAVTATTEPFRAHIARRVANPSKVAWLPNGTTGFWLDPPQSEPGKQRLELGLPTDRFLCTFAGNVGVAQGLEAVIGAARIMDDGFQVLILGNGPARASLEQLAQSVSSERVVFRNQVQPTIARDYLRASDCLLVSLAPHPILADFVPSKLFDFCAVGRPVILAADGEPRRLVSEAGAALCVRPGSASELSDAIRRLRRDQALRVALGEAGRRFAATNLRDVQVVRLAHLLDGVVSARRGSGRLGRFREAHSGP